MLYLRGTMDLKIEEVAELLQLPEVTIKRWLDEGKIPAYQINHEYRFSRMEIEDWLLNYKLGFKEDLKDPSVEKDLPLHSGGTHHFCLYRALHQGDVLLDVEGSTKEELIRAATLLIAPRLNLDPEVLSGLLLDREKMMATGLNQGIAVPHTREFSRKGAVDRIFVVYPKKMLPYGSLDGQDVHTLFFLFASHDKHHLQLLSKLAHLASQKAAPLFFMNKPLKKELLDFIRQWENQI